MPMLFNREICQQCFSVLSMCFAYEAKRNVEEQTFESFAPNLVLCAKVKLITQPTCFTLLVPSWSIINIFCTNNLVYNNFNTEMLYRKQNTVGNIQALELFSIHKWCQDYINSIFAQQFAVLDQHQYVQTPYFQFSLSLFSPRMIYGKILEFHSQGSSPRVSIELAPS